MSSTPLHPTPSPTKATIRTPLARVRGLGSAKDGTSHFWLMRVTSVLLIFVTIHAVALALSLIGADHATAKTALARPYNAVPVLMLVVVGVYHMYLGMQTFIEDYVHDDLWKFVWLMVNFIFSTAVGATCVYAVLKLSFGA